jgi:ubiquitin-conjugating enzyme E2 Q
LLLFSQETYPTTPPVWFSESEDANVTSGLGLLSETTGLDNHLLYQVSHMTEI